MTNDEHGPAIGEIIRSKRRDFDLDVEELGELTEIEDSRLRAFEGRMQEQPTFAELHSLSRILGVDLEVYDPEADTAPDELPQIVTLLKSNENYLPSSEWNTVIAAAEIARKHVRLEQWLELPERFAKLRDRFRPRAMSNRAPWKQGQLLAMNVREELELGGEPISSMYQLCNELDVLVIEAYLPVSVSALCLSDEQHGPTIILNIQGTNDSLLPRRFAIAHELCHVLFDEYEMESLRRFDNAPGFFEAKNKPDIEKRADAFAIHLLCPEQRFRHSWLQLEQDGNAPETAVRELMETFGASFTAIKSHLQSLDLLARKQADSLSMVDTDTPEGFREAEQRANPTSYDTLFTPLARMRRGPFLKRVLQAYRENLLTRSAVLEWLDIEANTFQEHVETWTRRLLEQSQ